MVCYDGASDVSVKLRLECSSVKSGRMSSITDGVLNEFCVGPTSDATSEGGFLASGLSSYCPYLYEIGSISCCRIIAYGSLSLAPSLRSESIL